MKAVDVIKKAQRKTKAKEFNAEFAFEDNFADVGFNYDPLQFAKKKRFIATTLDEKIQKVRKSQKEPIKEVSLWPQEMRVWSLLYV